MAEVQAVAVEALLSNQAFTNSAAVAVEALVTDESIIEGPTVQAVAVEALVTDEPLVAPVIPTSSGFYVQTPAGLTELDAATVLPPLF
jgi:hypothetical protein